MKVEYRADHDISAQTVQSATGRPLEVWFTAMDAKGGPAAGRKALGDYLVKEQKLNAWWSVTLIVEYEKSRGALEKDGRPRVYGICVTKPIAAPPPRGYAALLDARTWLGTGSTADVRETGVFDDGDGHCGVFRKLNPGKLIRFTWEGRGHQPGETVEIKLAASAAGISVVLNHDRLPDRPAADGMRAAWAKVLDSLRERLA